MKLTSILIPALLGKALGLPSRPGDDGWTPTCTDFFIPVKATAKNVVLPLPTSGPLMYQQISGTWNIGARYCEPRNVTKSRQNTLQVLVHGITYTRKCKYWARICLAILTAHADWSGDGEPNGQILSTGGPYNSSAYSWIKYASQEGFPTLSIDRLGNGLSDHPDPTNVLQTPLHVEVSHQIIAKARAGTLPIPNARRFSNIVFVGHSYGSVIGNSQNQKYPNDADVTILTGLNKNYNQAFIGNLAAGLRPAKIVRPSKWSGVSAGYLTIVNQTIFEQAYYYPGQFDQRLIDLDFSLLGTVGIGELDSALAFPPVLASAYKNPILDITGQHDSLMCFGDNPDQGTKPWKTYDCGAEKNSNLVATGTLYPNADYGYYAPSESGHCLNFHFSAQSTFAYAHNWLTSKGF